MHEPFSPLVLGALLAALPGCFLFNPDNSPPDQVSSCQGPSLAGQPPAAMRNVALGDSSSGDFRAYQAGEQAKLVTGGQGLTMITPWVRVEAAPGDPSDMCLLVHIETAYQKTPMDGGAAGGSNMETPENNNLQQYAKFVSKNGYLVTDGPLYNPLGNGFTLSFYELTITLNVRGDSFTGVQTITIEP